MSFNIKFANLGQPNKVWTLSALNGRAAHVTSLHQVIFDKFTPGDRIVYTGNYFCGPEADPLATMNELLHFHQTMTENNGAKESDFVYLRGLQEALWHKLLQIQFAPNAPEVVTWTEYRYPEIDALLRTYGTSMKDAGRVAREGVVNMTKWINFIKRKMRENKGHEDFFANLHRAAFTEKGNANDNLLFVHAGIDPDRPLTAQNDSFWWAGKDFNTLTKPYSPFRTVVRGFDPKHRGIHIGPVSISLDGGDQLLCAQISDTGEILELIAV